MLISPSIVSLSLHLLAYAIGIALIALAVRHAHRVPSSRTRGSVAGSVAWGVALLAWVGYDASGLVRCSHVWLAPLVSVLLAALSALTLVAPAIRASRARTPLAIVRPLFVVLCIPVALFLLEWPYNQELFAFFDDPATLKLNLGLVGMGLLALWFVGQRRNGTLLAGLIVCLGIGIANYFLVLFKGQTILPADVLALSTAAEVSSGYVFYVSDSVVAALCVLLVAALALAILPSPRLTRLTVPVNLVIGLVCVALLVNWYQEHDIEQNYGVSVDVWATRDSYVRYGSIPCFLQRMQEVVPEAPAGYDTETANELQAELAAAWEDEHEGANGSTPDAGGAPSGSSQGPSSQAQAQTQQQERPSVIAIMNESFSDLGLYEGVEGYDGIEERLAALGAFQRGQAYTSARGGGTCNSEFEYLTGSTLGSVGGGVYPYMFYDLSLAESLPHYFAALGYETTAIHPEAATNWRRDVVYEQMGFDRFLSQDDFDEDADRLRGMITDRETYDMILDVLAASDEAQFIFDVTLQNHGGYDTGLLDAYPYDDVTVNGQTIEGMSEYLSCIDASLDDIEYLLGELEKLDRPVIVVFFGDHQPGFNDALAETSMGIGESEMSIAQVQERFATPYFLWANYDVAETWGAGESEGADEGDEGDGAAADEGDAGSAAGDEAGGARSGSAGSTTRGDVAGGAERSAGTRVSPDAGSATEGSNAGRTAKDEPVELDLSLGYLMAQTVQATGLPLTEYQKALLQIEGEMPAVNLNGYQAADGTWYWIGQDSATTPTYDAYAILQYANLFDAGGNAAFTDFERSAERLSR